jgi:hypothetical protein
LNNSILIFNIKGVLEEDTLDDSDIISLDRSNLTSPKKPSTPVSRANISSFDESLHDEDAWMSILAVANAEVKILKSKFELLFFFSFSLMYSID